MRLKHVFQRRACTGSVSSLSVRRACALLCLVAGLGLVGCASLTPQAPEPAPALPTHWRHAPSAYADPVNTQWWRSFGSAQLDGLIDLAHRQSLDVAAAAARVSQAQARAAQVGAALWPQLTGQGQVRRQDRLGGQAQAEGSQWGAGFAASYEWDVWGKHQGLRRGALAQVQAGMYEQATVQLSVTASVAKAWLLGAGLGERLSLARANLDSAQRVLALVESRHRAGAAFSLELAQQRVLVAQQRSALARLGQQAEETQTALQVLLGQTSALDPAVVDWSALQLPAVDVGLPAQLLTRRPDIAQAEARLWGADADVLAARAAMLPSVTFRADLSTGGQRASQWLSNPLYALAAGLGAPIFDGARLAADRDIAMAQRTQLVLAYRQTIVQAFADVEMALHMVHGAQAQALAQQQELEQSELALALAESRYRAGAQTLLELIDAQRTLYAAQDTAVQLKLARLQGHVALYQALGGGWAQASDSPRS